MEYNPFKSSAKIEKIEIISRFKDIEKISNILEDLGASVSAFEYEITDHIDPEENDLWQIDGYFYDQYSEKELNNKLSELNKDISFEIKGISEVPDIDWVSEVQKNIETIVIPPFTIMDPSKEEKLNTKYLIKMSAGRAFGTGSHETTAMCIESISLLAEQYQFKDILDIGTGSGILAIASSMIFDQANITATDIDEIAVEVAEANAKINNTHNISFFHSNSPKNHNISKKKYDLILANILANPLIEMAESISNIIREEGFLVLSGFLENQYIKVLSEYENYGWKSFRKLTKGSWVALILRK